MLRTGVQRLIEWPLELLFRTIYLDAVGEAGVPAVIKGPVSRLFLTLSVQVREDRKANETYGNTIN